MRVYTYLIHKSFTLIALLSLLGSWQNWAQAQTNCVPPSVTFTASSSAVCPGQAVTLNAVVNPTDTYSYTISAPNGVTLSATNSATATATGLATGLNTFTVTVGSSQTCFTTVTPSVNVSNPPALAPIGVSLCGAASTPVNLSTILTSSQNAAALTGLTNTFVGTNGPVANPTSVNLTAGVNSFSVISTNANGCTTSTPLTVTLTAGPTLNLQITSINCNSATNQYTVSGTVSLTTTQANTLTITDGSVSTTVAVSNNTTSVPFTLPAQASGTNSHAIVASLPGCTTANVTTSLAYTAPTSCSVASPQLILNKLVSNSIANVGTVLTYTLVVSNVGSAAASNVVVTDSVSVGLRYVANTAPQGTTFTQGNPISTWTVGPLGVGQSISMTFQAMADSIGVLYSKARIPGTTVTVCTSIPYHVCIGDSYQFTLTAPAGRSNYHWYRTIDGVTTQLTSFTSNMLDVTAPGSYGLVVDNVNGSCQDQTCCPFIIIEDAFPTFSAKAIPTTCNGSTARADGQLILSGLPAGSTYTYQYSPGSTFDTTASLPRTAQVIPTTGIIATNLVNPNISQTYTVRVYNATGCYTDVTVTLAQTTCNCPSTICTPFVLKQSKGVARTQNRR